MVTSKLTSGAFMPRWPDKKLTPAKTRAVLKQPAARKPAARKAAPKSKMLQVGDVHVLPNEVLCVEGMGPLSCRIYTKDFYVSASVSHLAARQALDNGIPLTTWATPEEKTRVALETRKRMNEIEAEVAGEAEPEGDKADPETGPVLQ
jgi:hypothetical protein